MSFTDAEKTDIRRFCGYPVFGNVNDPAFGWRYFQQYGTLEFKMNNFSAAEESVIKTTYLPNLYTLETAIVGTSANLDTDQAAVWKHNKNEQRDREALFDNWRKRLCKFIGVEYGPGLNADGITMMV